MKGRQLIGYPSGSGFMDLSTKPNSSALDGAVDGFLDQTFNSIKTTSPFGLFSFHRDDTEAVVDGLRALADMIERNVVQ